MPGPQLTEPWRFVGACVALLISGSALPAADFRPDAERASEPWPQASARVQPDRKQPFFTLRSAERAGGEGIERLDVSVRARCQQPLWVFDHAELQVHEQRYARVELISTPRPGCLACAPLKVRWHHEPAGLLAFSVHVFRRQRVLDCSPREQG